MSFHYSDPLEARLACQVCDATGLTRVIDLGYQPLCNRFLPPEKLNEPLTFYPLCLYNCPKCRLGQLGYVLPTTEVFSPEFNYLSGTTRSVVRYFNQFATQARERFRLSKGNLVVDIGSNDGSLLKEFRNFGMKVIGVEGAPKPANLAIQAGIPTVLSFFGKGVGRQVAEARKAAGRLQLIMAFNVLAHTDNIHSFLDEVFELMEDETIFVAQSHYFPNLLRRAEFDTIYHEHLRYYTLTALVKLLAMHGFSIFDAELNEFYGGSLLICARRKSNTLPPSSGFLSRLEDEKTLDSLEVFEQFRAAALRVSVELPKLLTELRDAGKQVVGIGAPMKSSTLLNLCRITRDLVGYLAEVNPLKVGTYSPGVRLPVVHEDEFFHAPPDFGLILAWNVAEDIARAFRSRGFQGEFIVPLPQVRILS